MEKQSQAQAKPTYTVTAKIEDDKLTITSADLGGRTLADGSTPTFEEAIKDIESLFPKKDNEDNEVNNPMHQTKGGKSNKSKPNKSKQRQQKKKSKQSRKLRRR